MRSGQLAGTPANQWPAETPGTCGGGSGRGALALALAIAFVLVSFLPLLAVTAVQGQPDGAAMAAGKKLYDRDCSKCHQQNGKGVPSTFPPLAGNPDLKDAKVVVESIHQGHSGGVTVKGQKYIQPMPAIGAAYSPAEIASVATYVRNSWGNKFGAVTTEEAERLLGKK